MMNEIGLLEAWSLWRLGQIEAEVTLYGTPLVWWGRGGKVVQLVAALAILAEIVGPERLRHFGESLHGAISPQSIRKYLRDGWLWYRSMFKFTFLTKEGSEEQNAALKEAKSFGAVKLNYFLSLTLTAVCVYGLWGKYTWWEVLCTAVFAFLGLLLYICPVLSFLLLSFTMLLGLAVDYLILEPTAWAMTRPAIDRWIKLLSVFLLLMGFHFDLLAS